jgi:Putative Zn-dependent protease, contains TPR repeats
VALGDRKDPLLLAYAGDMFAMAGRCPRAVTLYRRALALAPRNIQLRANTAFCLINIGKVGEAKAIAIEIPDQASDVRLQAMVKTADSLESKRGDVLAKR